MKKPKKNQFDNRLQKDNIGKEQIYGVFGNNDFVVDVDTNSISYIQNIRIIYEKSKRFFATEIRSFCSI